MTEKSVLMSPLGLRPGPFDPFAFSSLLRYCPLSYLAVAYHYDIMSTAAPTRALYNDHLPFSTRNLQLLYNFLHLPPCLFVSVRSIPKHSPAKLS